MDNNIQAAIDKLQKLNVSIRQQLELAEVYLPALNTQLQQLGAVDCANGSVVLGDVIQERQYAPGLGCNDSAQFLQAALLVPEGIGIALWDMEEYVENQKSPSAGEDRARLMFVMFDQCSSVTKAHLLPQVGPLLERLFSRIGLIQS